MTDKLQALEQEARELLRDPVRNIGRLKQIYNRFEAIEHHPSDETGENDMQTQTKLTGAEKMYHALQEELAADKARKELEAEIERERAAKQAEGERAHLEARRKEREEKELLASLTPDERAIFEQKADPAKWLKGYVQQAMDEADKAFLEQVEARRMKKITDFRDKRQVYSNEQRHNFARQVDAEAQAEIDARIAAREQRQLQAERYNDDAERIMSGLDADERALFKKLWENRPNFSSVALEARKEVTQRDDEARQAELYSAFLQEVQDRGARGNSTHVANIRAKYIEQGMK